MIQLPDTIQRALNAKVELFMGEHCEWKFDLSEQPEFISILAERHILVFANNGFGDYLFLVSTPGDGTFENAIYEYVHEGPEILRIDDDLELLLGLRERAVSNDHYPQAIYLTGESVQLDDHVKFKVWAQFWKGWQVGKIAYVPGISAKNSNFEYGGLKWVAVQFQGGELCPVVNPKTGVIRSVRFVSRCV